MATELFKNSTGYKRLDVYILMNIIQLETLVFCRRLKFWGCVNYPACKGTRKIVASAAKEGL